jgi:hypothetical protein
MMFDPGAQYAVERGQTRAQFGRVPFRDPADNDSLREDFATGESRPPLDSNVLIVEYARR